MEIQAVVIDKSGTSSLQLCELDEPESNEVQVQIEACGICHTDLEAMQGNLGTPLPAILGHEGVGRIEKLGKDVTTFQVGDRVLLTFAACGNCSACHHHKPPYCSSAGLLNIFGARLSGQPAATLNGQPITSHFFGQSSFSSHTNVDINNIIKLPQSIAPELMAPLACGVQTGAGAVCNVAALEAGERIAVLGCGTVGMAAIMAAKNLAAGSITVLDKIGHRIDTALNLGANFGAQDLAKLKELAKQQGFDVIVDTTGHPEVIKQASACLNTNGRLILAAISPPETNLDIDTRSIVFRGLKVLGTVEGDSHPPTFIPRLIDWYQQGLLPLEKIVKTYPFEDFALAIKAMKAGDVIKPVLKMSGE